MVCSQVYSQHPSRCLLSITHQHRSWGPINAEMPLVEAETGDKETSGMTEHRGNRRPSNGYVSSGHASTSSPIRSSWIQRLIPSYPARAERPQLMRSLCMEKQGLNGSQADWSYDGVFIGEVMNQAEDPLFENSRRSKHETFLCNNTVCNGHMIENNPAASRVCNSVEAGQPKIQVPPRTLPVVESLLNPGCSKNAVKSMGASKLHNSTKCSGFATPVKQTVHFSAHERCRVSCSSIEGLNSRSGMRATGEFNASLIGERSLNGLEGAMRSNMGIYGSRRAQTCMHLGMESSNAPLTEDQNRVLLALTGWPSAEQRYTSDKSRLDRHLMADKARVDLFSEYSAQANSSTPRTNKGFPGDQKSMQTASDSKFWHSQAHQRHGKGANFVSEGSFAKGDSFVGGERLNSVLGNGGCQRDSELVSSQFEANLSEKASISLVHGVIEQGLGSSQESYKEQDRTSGSFSFHSKNRPLYASVDAKVVTERGQWPFCETTLYTEDLAQKSLPQDRRISDPGEALRLGRSVNNMPTLAHEVGTTYSNRGHCSPFFGTETPPVRPRMASVDDISPFKATCVDSVDSRAVGTGESNAQALHEPGVNQAAGSKPEQARELNDGTIFPRSQSDILIKTLEEVEHKYSLPPRKITGTNLEGFKPPFGSSTLSIGSLESCSNWPADRWMEDRAANAESSSSFSMGEGPSALPTACPGVPKSKGMGARSWNGSVFRRNIWLKRWAATRVREECSRLKSNRETSVVNSRHYAEKDYSASQGSWESTYQFDLRPAKRVCYGQKIGLHSEPCKKGIAVMGSVAFGNEREQGMDAASHFMKRFLTPSAAAMAIMGMTARKVHTTQPQRRGLFGVWPVNASANKPVVVHVEATKELMTKQEDRNEFLHSAEKPFSSRVDA